MFTRYFRKKDPHCRRENIEWVEMSGVEFYAFVRNPQNKDRHFIDMGDVVLEVDKADFQEYQDEVNHTDYLKRQEAGWETVSIYGSENNDGLNGEEVIADETQDVEKSAISNLEIKALSGKLKHLDIKRYRLIHDLYLAKKRKTERQLAKEYGVSQAAIHKQKKKIFEKLKV